jgi:hypothetical protein
MYRVLILLLLMAPPGLYAQIPPPRWRVTTSRSQMTDQLEVTATLQASAPIGGQNGPVGPCWLSGAAKANSQPMLVQI